MCHRDEFLLQYYDLWMDLKVKAIGVDYHEVGSL